MRYKKGRQANPLKIESPLHMTHMNNAAVHVAMSHDANKTEAAAKRKLHSK